MNKEIIKDDIKEEENEEVKELPEIKNEEENKEEKESIQSKIKSFTLSLFITYYIRLIKGSDEYLKIIDSVIHYLAKKFNIIERLEDTKFPTHSFKKLIEDEEKSLLYQMNIKKLKGNL